MASLAAIKRQVDRDGARWGLVAVIRDGAVKVCEVVSEITRPARDGTMQIPTKSQRVVCSLDESSSLDAFAMVLAHRLRREHMDFMKMVNRRRDRLRAEALKDIEARRRDLRRKLTNIYNHRIISTGIMR